MASGENRASASEGLDGGGLRIAIIHARWNTPIVDRLLEGALRETKEEAGAEVELK